MEISLEGGRVVGPRLLLSDKGYVRAKRPLKPQHGPWPSTLGVAQGGCPLVESLPEQQQDLLPARKPLDQSRKGMKCCTAQGKGCLALQGCLDAGGSLFLVEVDPMKIWL